MHKAKVGMIRPQLIGSLTSLYTQIFPSPSPSTYETGRPNDPPDSIRVRAQHGGQLTVEPAVMARVPNISRNNVFVSFSQVVVQFFHHNDTISFDRVFVDGIGQGSSRESGDTT